MKVLHSICQQIWKTQQWPQDWKRSVSFQCQRKAMPKNGQTTIQLNSSHTLSSKVMLKILQARLQQYVNCELPDIQAGFRKDRGNRDSIVNNLWIIKKASEFQKKNQKKQKTKNKKQKTKNIYFCFIYYAKAFYTENWKILKDMGIPDHLTCLLRNLYTGQEAIVTTGHGRTDCFKYFLYFSGVRQGCVLSPC